jgi:ABC-type Fe3+/spermidine/putrescine transport system ATPase subunit
MTVAQNVAFGLEMRRVPAPEARRRVQEALQLVELRGLDARYPSQLSGGQQQRVALARAVVTNPKILLLDEPLSNLDAKLRDRLRIELRELQQRLGLTTIYVTHDQAEALALSDRIAFMADGRIVETATPQAIYRSPRFLSTADFLGIANLIKGKVMQVIGDLLAIQSEIGAVSVRSDADVRAGDKNILCFRPEDLLLGEQAGDRNSLHGVIRHASYLGSLTDYVVELDGFSSTVRVHVPGPTRLSLGEVVPVRLPATAAVIQAETR